MTVLDASCLVSLLRGEPGQSDVVAALTGDCVMNVLNRAEVVDRLVRGGAVADDVGADLDILGIVFEPLTVDLADAAARLRGRYYARTERPVSMADCVALATAMKQGSALATSDAVLALVTVAVQCQLVRIANSKGDYPLRET